jgi:hypothetical protein
VVCKLGDLFEIVGGCWYIEVGYRARPRRLNRVYGHIFVSSAVRSEELACGVGVLIGLTYVLRNDLGRSLLTFFPVLDSPRWVPANSRAEPSAITKDPAAKILSK